MPHFVFGLDEECIAADHYGSIKILGSCGKSKHEKILADSRLSITLVRTGSAAGFTGPTIFLLKGVTRKPEFDDAFLLRKGCAPGSTTIMTDNAYMNNNSWNQCTPHI